MQPYLARTMTFLASLGCHALVLAWLAQRRQEPVRLDLPEPTLVRLRLMSGNRPLAVQETIISSPIRQSAVVERRQPPQGEKRQPLPKARSLRQAPSRAASPSEATPTAAMPSVPTQSVTMPSAARPITAPSTAAPSNGAMPSVEVSNPTMRPASQGEIPQEEIPGEAKSSAVAGDDAERQSNEADCGQIEESAYTPAALAAGLEGDFWVDVFVSASGLVQEAQPRRYLGYGMDQALTRTLLGRLCQPQRDTTGQAIAGWTTLRIRLRLAG